MKRNRGNMLVLPVVLAVVVMLVVWYLAESSKPSQQPAGVSIKTPAGLDAMASDLDETDLDQMDSAINRVGTDSSSF